MDSFQGATAPASLKRKRSSPNGSPTFSPQPPKVLRVSQPPAQLEINYLARLVEEDLSLITASDDLPSILLLLNQYTDVLDRHESLAYNLGARPLGPMLVKRFDRLFDAPPKTTKPHAGRNGQHVSVTWLDVIDYARTNPEQFALSQLSDGSKGCQFYIRGSQVQISEEDFLLVQSGIPQKMIPPQPIPEDEEKELGALEILERNISQIISMADQVAARARQLNHKLRHRKQAIVQRRASDLANSDTSVPRGSSPSNVALMNGVPIGAQVSPLGFVDVGARPTEEDNAEMPVTNGHADPASVSQSIRDELLKSFSTIAERRRGYGASNGYTASPTAASGRRPHVPPPTRPSTTPRPSNYDEHQLAASLLSYNPEHNPSTPTSTQAGPSPALPVIQSARQSTAEKDDGGLFRAEMVARLDSISKGDRIIPPCDRCRRLHMDCIKNLTACIGCTKKHARCSWRDVKNDELRFFSRRPATDETFTDGDASMVDVVETTPAPAVSIHSRDEQPHRPLQSQLQQESDQDYDYARHFRTHDDEMQAARSLAMAAVADGMQLQKDVDTSHGHVDLHIHPDLANHGNEARLLNNVDPSLQASEIRANVR